MYSNFQTVTRNIKITTSIHPQLGNTPFLPHCYKASHSTGQLTAMNHKPKRSRDNQDKKKD